MGMVLNGNGSYSSRISDHRFEDATLYFQHNRIDGVTVSVLASNVVDRGFIDGVTVSVLASSVVDRGFEPRSGQTKEYQISIGCFSAKHVSSRERTKTGWLGIGIMCPSGNDMLTCGLLFH